MNNKRKVELYDELLGYICELISDKEELTRVLLNLGFTREEIKSECCIDIDED